MSRLTMWKFKFRSIGVGVLTAIAPLTILGSTSAPAQAEITIGSGFSPNPIEARGTGGGSTPVKNLVSKTDTPTGECIGFASNKPDHTLVLSSFFKNLSLQVQSTEDTALVIQGPGGVWCNDDEQGKNPGVSGEWLAGTYKIWISSYAKNSAPSYTLRITEKR